MSRKIKLIWDFRGPASAETAKHHWIHLCDYATIEKLDIIDSGHEANSDVHAIAFLVVHESDMLKVRDQLKPHRGLLHED